MSLYNGPARGGNRGGELPHLSVECEEMRSRPHSSELLFEQQDAMSAI